MTYNEELADRVREALVDLPTVAEKKMFGGVAFMVDDKMCITVGKDRIMCRIDPNDYEELLESQGVEPVRMKGREYKGYLHISEDVLRSKKNLDYWIELALNYNKHAKSSKGKRVSK